MEAMTDAGMRARVRDFDWAATALGPAKGWPQSLKWSVDTILTSGFPHVRPVGATTDHDL